MAARGSPEEVVMRTFDYGKIRIDRFSARCEELVGELFECKGRVEVVKRVYPDLLSGLRDRAFADSVGASARLEGLAVDDARVLGLLEGAEPEGDLEGQLHGYARALRRIERAACGISAADDAPTANDYEGASVSAAARRHVSAAAAARASAAPRSWNRAHVSTRDALAAHEDLFYARGFDGKSRYRRRDHAQMIVDGEPRSVQVSPVAAFETPLHLGAMCDALDDALERNPSRAVVLIAVFMVDLMCVRPFDEGTGRVSRLLAHQMLVQSGFDVCMYVSLDRLFEQDAMAYYDALNACAAGWDRSRNSYEPFVAYWLEKLSCAYAELLALTPLATGGHPSKSERVRMFFSENPGVHAKRDVALALSDVSTSTIEAALGDLVKEGYLRKVGAGRSTSYELAGGSCSHEGAR